MTQQPDAGAWDWPLVPKGAVLVLGSGESAAGIC